MKSDEKNAETENQKSNDVIFAPIEHIWNIENVLAKLERTRRELRKVAEGMKIAEN